MNKVIIRFVFLMFLAIAIPALAQESAEIPAEPAATAASEPATVVAPAPAPTPAPTIAPAGLSAEALFAKSLREGVPLRVRQEQAFDANGNNRLDPDEIKAFLKSVYEDAAKGPVKNTSDILYHFDTNKDGFIDRGEASSLSRY